jgi:hypothetical protein
VISIFIIKLFQLQVFVSFIFEGNFNEELERELFLKKFGR